MKHPLLDRIEAACRTARREAGLFTDPDTLRVSPDVMQAIRDLALQPVEEATSVRDEPLFQVEPRLMSVHLEEVTDHGTDYMEAVYTAPEA